MQFNNNNLHTMWKGIKALTNHKVNNPMPSEDAALPHVLNHFFTHFESQEQQPAPHIDMPADATTSSSCILIKRQEKKKHIYIYL